MCHQTGTVDTLDTYQVSVIPSSPYLIPATSNGSYFGHSWDRLASLLHQHWDTKWRHIFWAQILILVVTRVPPFWHRYCGEFPLSESIETRLYRGFSTIFSHLKLLHCPLTLDYSAMIKMCAPYLLWQLPVTNEVYHRYSRTRVVPRWPRTRWSAGVGAA